MRANGSSAVPRAAKPGHGDSFFVTLKKIRSTTGFDYFISWTLVRFSCASRTVHLHVSVGRSAQKLHDSSFSTLGSLFWPSWLWFGDRCLSRLLGGDFISFARLVFFVPDTAVYILLYACVVIYLPLRRKDVRLSLYTKIIVSGGGWFFSREP